MKSWVLPLIKGNINSKVLTKGSNKCFVIHSITCINRAVYKTEIKREDGKEQFEDKGNN